jgi:Flp pilus assembly pilin Flp
MKFPAHCRQFDLNLRQIQIESAWDSSHSRDTGDVLNAKAPDMLRLIVRLTADTAGVTFIESAVMWGVVACAVLGGFADSSGEIGANLSQIATTFNLR